MRRSSTALLAGSVVLGVTLVAPTPAQASTPGTPLGSHRDASGRVTVTVFTDRNTPARPHWVDEVITVPDQDMIAIGGGATATNQGAGALLTASYPTANLDGWVVSSKDHLRSSPHELTTYVIGLKIAGMSRDELRAAVRVESASNSGPHPEAEAGVPSGTYELVGGGFKIDWNGAGNLATASFPSSASSWKARSKDHGQASPATLHSYAIGLRRSLPVGTVSAAVGRAFGSQAAHPTATAVVPDGHALTGGGAEVRWGGAGSLLWKLEPTRTATPYFIASAKDHVTSDPATVDVYAVGIRLT